MDSDLYLHNCRQSYDCLLHFDAPLVSAYIKEVVIPWQCAWFSTKTTGGEIFEMHSPAAARGVPAARLNSMRLHW